MSMGHGGGAHGGQGENWQMVYKSEDHGASVNGVAWAPWEYGPYLASASSDGKIAILHHSTADQQWLRTEFHAHANGVNAVSWAPAATPVVLASGPATQGPSLGPMRIVSGGSDNQVKLWQYEDRSQKWVERAGIDANNGHTDVIRDVAWRPNIVGAPSSTIASCSEDKTVIIWTQEMEMEGQPWKKAQVIQLDGPVWRVDWSVTGSVLAVACGDNQVLLYKENLEGKWELITNLSDTQHTAQPQQQQQAGAMDAMGGGMGMQQQQQSPPPPQQQQQQQPVGQPGMGMGVGMPPPHTQQQQQQQHGQPGMGMGMPQQQQQPGGAMGGMMHQQPPQMGGMMGPGGGMMGGGGMHQQHQHQMGGQQFM